ncbi:hypothetical protein JW906_01685, partial [bacterium]|nr:hypothetical protein [bacterium]
GVHHLLATWNRGVSLIWIDGWLQKGHVGITDTQAPVLAGLGKSRVSRLAFGFFILFPFSVSIFPVFRRKAFGYTILVTLLFLVSAQWILYQTIGQPGDFVFLLAGSLAAVTGAITGWSICGEHARYGKRPASTRINRDEQAGENH